MTKLASPSAMDRREFLAAAGAVNAAFVLGFWLPPRTARAAENARERARRRLVRGSRYAGDQRLDPRSRPMTP